MQEPKSKKPRLSLLFSSPEEVRDVLGFYTVGEEQDTQLILGFQPETLVAEAEPKEPKKGEGKGTSFTSVHQQKVL